MISKPAQEVIPVGHNYSPDLRLSAPCLGQTCCCPESTCLETVFCMSRLIALASDQGHDFSGGDLFYLFGFLMGTWVTSNSRACRLSSKPCPATCCRRPNVALSQYERKQYCYAILLAGYSRGKGPNAECLVYLPTAFCYLDDCGLCLADPTGTGIKKALTRFAY